jgi:small-conductance mechanosensitive channel
MSERLIAWLCGLAALFLVTAGHAQVPAAPVMFQGETLFEIRAPLGAFTAAAGGAAIAGRLEVLAGQTEPVRITVGSYESVSEISSGQAVIMAVTVADAAAENQARDELAAIYAQRLAETLVRAQTERSTQYLRQSWLYTTAATVALGLFLFGLRAAVRRGRRHIEARRDAGRLALNLQNAELVSAERMAVLLLRGMTTLALSLALLALYFHLSLVFSFFPATRAWAALLIGALLAPLRAAGLALLDYLPNVGVILLVVGLTVLFTRFVRFVFDALGAGTLRFKGFHPEWAQTTFKIARFVIMVFAAVVIFPYLPGAGSPGFQGISIFIGALLSLGSGSAVANIVAGIVLTYTRAFRIGDRIRVNDSEGDVIGHTLIATRVRTIKNVDIVIPNAVLLGNHMINYSTVAEEQGLILHSKVTIGYDVPWRQVHELLIAAARDTQLILAEPAPYVLQTSLDDFYVSYQINATTRASRQQASIYSELHQHIQDRFHTAGVEILSPHYAAVRDGQAIAMPAENLPADYVAPPFRLNLRLNESR